MWTIILEWRSERFSSKFIIWATVPKRRLTWQIDASVINCMDDEALAVYIPIYGDRIAARHICVQCLGASSTEGRWKVHYLKTKKKRMVIEGSDDDNNYPGTSTLKRKKGNCKNNKWAGKATRKVEVGWIHEGKQLRTSKGGNDYDESDTVGWGTKIGGIRDFISALKPQSMWMRKTMDWKTQTWTWMDNWMMCMEEMSNFIDTDYFRNTSEVQIGPPVGEPMAKPIERHFAISTSNRVWQWPSYNICHIAHKFRSHYFKCSINNWVIQRA